LKIYILLIFVFCFIANIKSQNTNNFKKKHFITNNDSIVLDSMLIFPSSLLLMHNKHIIKDSLYTLDINKGIVILSERLRKTYSNIDISYRVLDISINENTKLREKSNISSFDTYTRYRFTNRGKIYTKTDDGNLKKEGSYTRGFSFGNTQDIMLNSKLDLRLSGILKDSIRISAVISDNNIALQAEGNTQKLQEFDKIYIKIYDNKQELTLGDYLAKNDDSSFLKFRKKAQGAQYVSTRKLHKKYPLNNTISLAIAKGKYHKLEINGVEGNQGPYKLLGAENEQYILILSDSEKIYINGEKLIRGENNDYTINYNTAEIKFTGKRIINSNSRIIVEYEYSEENYARFFIFSKNEYKNTRFKIWLNAYGEKDNKNKTLGQKLNAYEKKTLSELGDNKSLLFSENVDSVGFIANKILYKKSDININDKTYSIYKYSNNKDSALYRVRFIFTGQNKGNYHEVKSHTNGKIYEWVAPENNVPQGSYTINRRLICPESHSIINSGISYNIDKNTRSNLEISFSSKDKNTFSSKDDKDNNGVAALWKGEKVFLLKEEKIQITNKLNFEFISKNYIDLENRRDIEFSRDWNINKQEFRTDETLINFKSIIKNTNWGQTSYEIAYLSKKNIYDAYKQSYDLNYNYKHISLDIKIDWLNSKDIEYSSNFLRTNSSLKYNFSKSSIGVSRKSENNNWHNKLNSTVLEKSFKNESYKLFAEKYFDKKTHIKLFYTERVDKSPQENIFIPLSKSKDMGAELSLLKNKSHSFKANMNYRRFRTYQNNDNKNNKEENTFINRIEHKLKIKKSFIYSSIFYELSSGLESKKDYKYIEIAAGQGNYIWIDYNKNEIQELNEFELSNFKDEAKYIRVNIPSNDYTRVYTKEYRQSIHIKPSTIFKKHFIKHLSNKLSFSIREKTSNSEFVKYANPFIFKSQKDDIFFKSYIHNIFSFKQIKKGIRIDYIYRENKDKQKINNTIVNNYLLDNGISLNYKSRKAYQFKNKFNLGNKKHGDNIFAKKSYNISFIHNEIELKIQRTLGLQFGMEYIFKKEKNKLDIELMESHNFGAKLSSAIKKKAKLRFSYNFIKIHFEGNANESINYTMLAGLHKGNNSLWSISYRQQLSSLFHINISYNGRKSSLNKPVHNASMEIRANF